MQTLAKQYDLSDVGLAKTCKRLKIPVPGRGYWAKKAAGHKLKQPHVGRDAQRPFHEVWSSNPSLKAVSDIANLSKHFQLREPNGTPRSAQTRRLRHHKGEMIDVYLGAGGNLKLARVEAPEITITLSDGSKYNLATFTLTVIKYWREYLKADGVRVRRQSVEELLGD